MYTREVVQQLVTDGHADGLRVFGWMLMLLLLLTAAADACDDECGDAWCFCKER